MARDLPIGNGNVLINFDAAYNIRDIYYPLVGQENQSSDHLSHFGIWCKEGFFWIDHPEVSKKLNYLEDSLVTNAECAHERLGLSFVIRDGVDVQQNVFLRKVKVENHFDVEREIKLYFHLDLQIYGNGIGDTIYYDPELNSLLFYKGHRYMSLSCLSPDAEKPMPSGYATGQKGIHGLEGTWRDAEDGHLGGNPIAQGSVDGVIELTMILPPKGAKDAWFWICFGKTKQEVERMERLLRTATPQALLQRTHDHWVKWVNQDAHQLSLLKPDLESFYKRCLLITRTNVDNRGAIIAANDSDILKFAKDTYSYMWPRDGALVSHALDRAGYYELSRKFFDFCKKVLTPEGYLMHKYNPDSSVGSSWHPWVDKEGKKQLAIQEDETALVLYTLWHHHKLAGTIANSREDYEKFVKPAADFLVQYRDASGLPLPSYDLWEERFGVLAFTVSSVYAGLVAAARFAEYHQDKVRSIYYADIAGQVKKAAEQQLYATDQNRFLRALYWSYEENRYVPDYTLDMSMYGLFDFGLFELEDPRIVATMQILKEKLWVHTDIGGIARYENDYYHQVTNDVAKVPGNPWFICTLWYAEWLVASAKTVQDLLEAEKLMRWAIRHALPSGAMAEQVHPFTGEPMSVSPLTWSHASFIKVTQEYLSKLKQLTSKGTKQAFDASEDKVLEPVVH
ncbi:Glucoamylase (glucan-1,4-alpha-glucosidase), GH15 family [Paenibacillus sp. yr247]|uniref:glycoside hydrolase family 15 protein n=1 Tax=Paenibacillus sp. yr247 TaxID=1761880 RepID=UPI0008900547|nr:glycoside hydrolase family 15 protein [Paenibacillus sp. yr247]SDN17995.1 Glucoamylase (glucan-1,4-alpha-glucosidase), GH15 family [Paenibacillus sp. yr247]